ncbi:MAG: cytochrome c [Chloroflexi bacterium]|nr:cytochrome c [Chloroflexota bacterium]MBU1750457.1 cytochrome c [Chloroflexota bacterium]MBU1877782.1 cytochrome c [Chloroflexota bacterium]
MNTTTRWFLILGAAVAVGLVGVCLVAICVIPGIVIPGLTGYPTGPGAGTFTSNGQRIYFTATSARGTPITASGGSAGMGMMGRLACATCHGADGRGGPVRMMMYSVDVPDIRHQTLTSEDPAGMEHAPYTDETIKQAITQGVEPNGQSLDPFMPRWSMSEQDLNDLLAFLKTL